MSKKVVIQICGLPDGGLTSIDGFFVRNFDFEHGGGVGSIDAVPDIRDAMQFDDMDAAIAFYLTQPKCRPIRWDGRPNRPLTATTVAFLPYVELPPESPIEKNISESENNC